MRRIILLRAFIGGWFAVAGATAATSQVESDSRGDRREIQLSTAERDDISEQEIVVTGIRLIEGEPPIPARRTNIDVSASRGQFLRAEQFARCADTPRVGLLRQVIDGPPNDADTRHALDTLIRNNLGCYPDYPNVARSHPPALGTCHAEMVGNLYARGVTEANGAPHVVTGVGGQAVCRALYTRGAVLEQVLRTYAPELKLTGEETWREDVVRRFDEREKARNSERHERDYRYFAVAACLVQAQPELASFLVRSAPASRLSLRIQETMLARAPHCVGFAQSVKADPLQFRIYIADAVYRWLVAARGVDSLLPSA